MSKSNRNLHAWKTRTEDGRRREVRARFFATKWTFTSRCKDEVSWTEHSPPALADLEELEAVLFRKYQRKHIAWEHLLDVRNLIAERKARLPRD